MIIKVTSCNENNKITFASNFGDCYGYWMDNDKPKIGKSYSVEIDLIGDSNIKQCNEEFPSLAVQNDRIKMTALLDRCEDNCLMLIFGDSIVEVVVKDATKFESLLGKHILLYSNKPCIYDEHIL